MYIYFIFTDKERKADRDSYMDHLPSIWSLSLHSFHHFIHLTEQNFFLALLYIVHVSSFVVVLVVMYLFSWVNEIVLSRDVNLSIRKLPDTRSVEPNVSVFVYLWSKLRGVVVRQVFQCSYSHSSKCYTVPLGDQRLLCRFL